VLVASDAEAYWRMSGSGRNCLTSEDARDWFLGDPAFDRFVHMVGPRPQAIAALTPDVRGRLVALLDGKLGPWQKVTLQCRPVVIQFSPALEELNLPRYQLPAGRLLATIIDAMIPLLHELAIADEDLLPALLANAAADPLPSVRRQALDTLLSLSPGSAVLDKAVAFARHDKDASVRVWAAKVATDTWGMGVLTEVAASATSSADLRLEAMDFLMAQQPIPILWPVLEAHWQLADSVRRHALVRHLLDGAEPATFVLLAGFLKRCAPEAAVDGLEQLGRCHNALVEDVLLTVLEADAFPVRLATVQALGLRGTGRVLPTLVELSADPALATEAETAIVKIRVREGIADAGQLSLAESAVGAVSLVKATGGLEIVDGNGRKP
jgi:hypothetical protein